MQRSDFPIHRDKSISRGLDIFNTSEHLNHRLRAFWTQTKLCIYFDRNGICKGGLFNFCVT